MTHTGTEVLRGFMLQQLHRPDMFTSFAGVTATTCRDCLLWGSIRIATDGELITPDGLGPALQTLCTYSSANSMIAASEQTL